MKKIFTLSGLDNIKYVFWYNFVVVVVFKIIREGNFCCWLFSSIIWKSVMLLKAAIIKTINLTLKNYNHYYKIYSYNWGKGIIKFT